MWGGNPAPASMCAHLHLMKTVYTPISDPIQVVGWRLTVGCKANTIKNVAIHSVSCPVHTCSNSEYFLATIPVLKYDNF